MNKSDENRKYNPNSGSIAGMVAPMVVFNGVRIGTIAGMSNPYKKSDANKSDYRTNEHLVARAREAGGDVRAIEHPFIPAVGWNTKKKGFIGQSVRDQVNNITNGEGPVGLKGVAMSRNVRPAMKSGIFAHEVGHLVQPSILHNPLYHGIGQKIPGIGALYAAGTKDQDKAKKAAIISSAAALPMMASEVDASVRGSSILRRADRLAGVKHSMGRRLTPFAGIPSYAASAAAPWLAYGAKKAFGGYKHKEKQTNLSAIQKHLVQLASNEGLVERKTRIAKNVALTGLGIAGTAGIGVAAHKLNREYKSIAKETRKNTAAKINSIIENTFVTSERAKNAMAIGSDVGKIYSTHVRPVITGGAATLRNPVKVIKAAYREGRHGAAFPRPGTWAHTIGSKARKIIRGFNSDLSDIISFKAIDLGRDYPSSSYPSCGESLSNNPTKKDYPSFSLYDREEPLDLPMEGKATIHYKMRRKSSETDSEGKTRHTSFIDIHSIDPIEEKENLPGKAKLLKMSAVKQHLIQLGFGEAVADGAEAVGATARKVGNWIMANPGKSAGIGAVGAGGLLLANSLRKQPVVVNQDNATENMSAIQSHLISFADPRPRNGLGEFSGQQEEGSNPQDMAKTYRCGLAQAGVEGAVGGAAAAGTGMGVKALVQKFKRARK